MHTMVRLTSIPRFAALFSVLGFGATAAVMVLAGWTSVCGFSLPGGTC
jgi:hypothetical protein